MPKLILAPTLARWLQDAGTARGVEIALDAAGEDLGALLEQVFAQQPRLRGYVVDEHGAVRHHVAIFVDGRAIGDKRILDQPLSPHSEVYIMQALSGG